MTVTKTNCKCGEPAEWCDRWCQMCWEAHTSSQWWAVVGGLQEVQALEDGDRDA